MASAHQLGELAGLVFPRVCVGQGGLAFGDALPGRQPGQLGVELGHVLLVGRYVLFGIDGVDRALGDAHSAVNALIRVNGEEVGAFAEAVYGADIHTVGVFAADTGFRNNVGHGSLLGLKRYTDGIARKNGILKQLRAEINSPTLRLRSYGWPYRPKSGHPTRGIWQKAR